MYALGVDLGTTYTAAASWRDDQGEIVPLGSRSATLPSVLLFRDDGTFLVGDAANRRGLTEPDRVAREFKRRFGDTTPILLGGTPHPADALTTELLRSVVEQVTTSQGGRAGAVCLSHPANWGPYKTELLRQAVRRAVPDQPVTYTTEPEAAAAFYAHQQRVEPGAVVAVYDLGGGTFDATVLRRTDAGFEILGRPEGIERLGGIDFDAAVFHHVRQALGTTLDELDEDDPAAVAAVARLREECTAAREYLSADTDVTIPVLLPTRSTEVRLTRAELETMVRPALHSTVDALRRALHSAGVTPDELRAVLLVGGGSRMPLVTQLVGAELGRPVAVDAHPTHAAALGAARLAAGSLEAPAAGAPRPSGAATPTPAAPAGGAPAAPATGRTAPVPPVTPAPPVKPVTQVPPVTPVPFARPSPVLAGRAAVPPRRPEPDPPAPPAADPPRRRWPMLAAATVLFATLGTTGVAMAIMDPGGLPPPETGGDPTSRPPTTPATSSSPSPARTPTPDETESDPPTTPATSSPPTSPSPSPTHHPTTTTTPAATIVTVPDVIGNSCLYAIDRLESEGFRVERTGPTAAPEPAAYSQEPAGGAEAPAGSWVTIECR